MCCGVVPILFGWFLRVPSLHASGGSRILKGRFQYAIEARVGRLLGGSGDMPSQENFGFLTF